MSMNIYEWLTSISISEKQIKYEFNLLIYVFSVNILLLSTLNNNKQIHINAIKTI